VHDCSAAGLEDVTSRIELRWRFGDDCPASAIKEYFTTRLAEQAALQGSLVRRCYGGEVSLTVDQIDHCEYEAIAGPVARRVALLADGAAFGLARHGGWRYEGTASSGSPQSGLGRMRHWPICQRFAAIGCA
jgi:hypothetical protein